MTRFVGDWSNHDWGRGGMNFAAMRADGIEGGWHKSSDGLRFYTDPYFAGAISQMRSAFKGGPVGAYHVLWGNRDIRAQILWWFEILDATAPGWRTDRTFVLVTDNEPFGYNTAPSVAQINQAGDIIRELVGKRQLAYCPPWHYGNALSGLRYPLISSNYGGNPVARFRAVYPGDGDGRWTSAAAPVAVLQYGSQTRMGSQSTCDANAIRDPQVWTQLAGGDALMNLLTDPDNAEFSAHFYALIYRVLSLIDGSDTIQGGPTKGQSNELAKMLKRVAADAAASRATDAANATSIAALQAVVTGLADTIKAGGGNVETAGLLERVQSAADEVKALVEQHHQEEVAAITAEADRRVRALEAELAVLRPTANPS